MTRKLEQLRLSADYPDYNPGSGPAPEQEPTIERGRDTFNVWWKVFVIIVATAVAIGFVASVSYTVYPYSVTVSGTFFSKDGGRAQLVDFYECDDMIYVTCPNPSETPVDDCVAPADMNMTNFCTEYFFDSDPGHYEVNLRNGENYVMKGYMINAKGAFDTICTVTVILYPPVRSQNSTQNFLC